MTDSVAHFRKVQNTTAQVNNSESGSSVKINYDDWITGEDTIDLEAV